MSVDLSADAKETKPPFTRKISLRINKCWRNVFLVLNQMRVVIFMNESGADFTSSIPAEGFDPAGWSYHYGRDSSQLQYYLQLTLLVFAAMRCLGEPRRKEQLLIR